jgi:hypothetical protein
MLRQSSLVCDSSRARSVKEEKYYMTFAALLFICGALFLIIPVLDKNGALILAVSWVLLAVLALDLIRPLFYSRGVADVVMVIFTACLYALLGYVVGMNALLIEEYRLAVCMALFFAGMSRIFAYARMIVVINLPLMLICGFSEITAAFMLLMGWPGLGAAIIYWFLGMTVIMSGFESMTEATKIRAQR